MELTIVYNVKSDIILKIKSVGLVITIALVVPTKAIIVIVVSMVSSLLSTRINAFNALKTASHAYLHSTVYNVHLEIYSPKIKLVLNVRYKVVAFVKLLIKIIKNNLKQILETFKFVWNVTKDSFLM